MPKLPRPLRDRQTLQEIETLDAQFKTRGNGGDGRGSFKLEFHYDKAGDPQVVKVVLPTFEREIRKDLTEAEDGR